MVVRASRSADPTSVLFELTTAYDFIWHLHGARPVEFARGTDREAGRVREGSLRAVEVLELRPSHSDSVSFIGNDRLFIGHGASPIRSIRPCILRNCGRHLVLVFIKPRREEASDEGSSS